MTLTITGSGSWNSLKSGTKTTTVNSLFSGNAFLFVDDDWNGTGNIAVNAKFEDLAGPVPAPDVGNVKDQNFPIDWTIVKRNQCPTTMQTVAGATNTFRANPAAYTYKVGPALPAPATAPYYTNETILESFGQVTAYNFAMADLTDAFKTAHPALTTPDMVAQFFWGIGNNGTFVVGTNGPDLIADQHGRGSMGAAEIAAFTAAANARGIGYNLPQTYSCGGTTIQDYIITTKYTNGVPTISKTGP
jgi:hypothetical protein